MRSAIVAVFTCFLFLSAAHCEKPQLKKTRLWFAGENGYDAYRIPGIVVTSDGTVLAYAVARRHLYGVARRHLGNGDWGDIDIVLRRSTDDGKHWGKSRRIAGNSNGVTDNPVAIASRENGVVHFLYQHQYTHVYYMKSTDDGASFSAPVDITSALTGLRQQFPWSRVAVGPGHGIELKNGRLLVPVWLEVIVGQIPPTGRGHWKKGPFGITTIYSDDQGKTWQHGDIIALDTPEMRDPNEFELIQLADGSVMANIRTSSMRLMRAVAVSPNGISHWTKPEFDPHLYDPVCAAGIARYDSHRILFTNPDSSTLPRTNGEKNSGRGSRENLTVRMSEDEGKTWPVSRLLVPGQTGYSDIAVDQKKDIFDIYEYEKQDDPESIALSLYVARFNLAWLNQKP